MGLKIIFNFGLGALLLLVVHVSVADPQINERERENEKYDPSSPIIKMTSSISHGSIVGWKYFSYLQKYPANFDVAFVVGPKKVIVRALKIALTSSSPVFEREFEGRWEQAVMEEDNGIPLPDLDPEAFKLFVELMILDNWSVEALTALELPSNQLLHLMSICHKYEMTTGLKNLRELAKDFISNFGTHVKPEDFLLLSQGQLEAILASDELLMTEVDIYHYAYSWATEQCKYRNLEVKGKNLRSVLGDCVYQIRFPTMSVTDFANLTSKEGPLTLEETLQIFQLIGMAKNGSNSDHKTELKFKTGRRNSHLLSSVPEGSSKVSLAQVYPVTDTPIECKGNGIGNRFNMNMKISLHGFGFLGPIDLNSVYNVTIQLKKYILGVGYIDITSKMHKRIFAQKSNIFYFIFDQPIVLNAIPYDGWNNFYFVAFELTGPKTRSLQYQYEATKTIHDCNNKFVIYWRSGHLVEIVYSTL